MPVPARPVMKTWSRVCSMYSNTARCSALSSTLTVRPSPVPAWCRRPPRWPRPRARGRAGRVRRVRRAASCGSCAARSPRSRTSVTTTTVTSSATPARTRTMPARAWSASGVGPHSRPIAPNHDAWSSPSGPCIAMERDGARRHDDRADDPHERRAGARRPGTRGDRGQERGHGEQPDAQEPHVDQGAAGGVAHRPPDDLGGVQPPPHRGQEHERRERLCEVPDDAVVDEQARPLADARRPVVTRVHGGPDQPDGRRGPEECGDDEPEQHVRADVGGHQEAVVRVQRAGRRQDQRHDRDRGGDRALQRPGDAATPQSDHTGGVRGGDEDGGHQPEQVDVPGGEPPPRPRVAGERSSVSSSAGVGFVVLLRATSPTGVAVRPSAAANPLATPMTASSTSTRVQNGPRRSGRR